jgi:tRNA(Ile)-lysidine synthase
MANTWMGYNLIKMLDNMNQILLEECLLVPDQHIVVGVSGGPDSLCMLDLLLYKGYSPIVAHFNHKLRPEADIEAEVIRNLSAQLDLPFILGEAQVKEIAADERKSIEEAARHSRYRFLFESAEKTNAQAVAVGHSADDQVETVLMHLLRGAGTSGLRGMEVRSLPNAWSEDIPLVRPLLSTWRTQILDYCQEKDLDPISDSTNQDLTYFRNRLRHELIPYLEGYNPSIRRVIWRTAEVLRGDLQLVDSLVENVWQDCFVSEGPGYIELDKQRSSEQPLSIQRNLIRRAIASLRPGLRDINFHAVELGRKYLQNTLPPAEVDLISGLRIVTEPERLWVAEWDVQLPAGEWPQLSVPEVSLQIPGNLPLGAGWQLSAEEVPVQKIAENQVQLNEDPFQALVDSDTIHSPLLVRSRRQGDRFQPFGMDGHSIKLSDFMINMKLPKRARGSWPLVFHSGQLIWVPGFRTAHSFSITDNTRRAVNLRLYKR